eukprot:3722482-Amphidinium_carterae.1
MALVREKVNDRVAHVLQQRCSLSLRQRERQRQRKGNEGHGEGTHEGNAWSWLGTAAAVGAAVHCYICYT